jgi:hypothetical protein
MSVEAQMKKSGTTTAFLEFLIWAFFVIRHSCFVIFSAQ